MKMEYYYHKISMLGLLLMALVSFSSCMDDDSRLGYNIQGHWFGITMENVPAVLNLNLTPDGVGATKVERASRWTIICTAR